jgi:predicted double-glycine peptidase
MADDRTLKGPQDRSRISLSEPYEIQYWTKKFGVTPADLREAIKKVGNSAEAVEKELGG